MRRPSFFFPPILYLFILSLDLLFIASFLLFHLTDGARRPPHPATTIAAVDATVIKTSSSSLGGADLTSEPDPLQRSDAATKAI